MNDKIKYIFDKQEYFFLITKFKAFESLDFLLSICNSLPDDIKISEEVTLKKSTIKYIVDIVMDIGEDNQITQEQKDYLQQLHNMNIIKLIFKEAFYNSDKENRLLIANKLTALLLQNGEPVRSDFLNIIFDNPKKLFTALIKIVEFNYLNFFLLTNA